MEIEEMQALWSEMSDQLKQQKKLTNEIIMNMTRERYRNKFKTLSTFESFGACICFIAAVFILLNFNKLDTWYLSLCGIFTLAFLVVLPILVLKSLYKIKNLGVIDKNYSQMLINYTKAKTNLLRLQQYGIYASLVQLFSIAIVFAKILSDKDFFMVEREWIDYIPMFLAFVFILLVANWGYNHYVRITNSAEGILKELE